MGSSQRANCKSDHDAVSRCNAAYQNAAISALESTDLISVIEPATLPDGLVRPRTGMNTLLAAGVGAIVAVVGIFLRETLDTSVKSPDEIATLTRAAGFKGGCPECSGQALPLLSAFRMSQAVFPSEGQVPARVPVRPSVRPLPLLNPFSPSRTSGTRSRLRYNTGC